MKFAKPILKLIISGLILYFIFHKIDIEALKEILRETKLGWLFLGFVFFVISQFISSLRLHLFWSVLAVRISKLDNWKLYLIGMYYNLLLPGGIGGDGYKVYVLDQDHKTGKKKLIAALIYDRLAGLLALFLWLCVLFSIYTASQDLSLILPITLVFAGLCSIPVAYLVLMKLSPIYHPLYFSALAYSILVQGLQLVTCVLILYALGAFNYILPYLAVFLVSSVAAVIPITFGGAGARELTFLASANYFPSIDVNIAVSLGLLFYIISVIASLLGIGYSFKQKIE
jgi:uncharacterized membrane protein YbhN (UPF0104 family)